MEATRLPQHGSSLFAHAVSRLMPEVFTHPIWEKNWEKHGTGSAEAIENLQKEAKQLQGSDPDCACQVLLICAVYQNYAGQRDNALRSIQQILSLAERHNLSEEIVRATWGACAICVQAGNYDQAIRHLHNLQTILQSQNDWILANFIEIVGQYLNQAHPTGIPVRSGPPLDRPLVDLMSTTFDWLCHWGFPFHFAVPDLQPSQCANLGEKTNKLISGGLRWQKCWHAIEQVIRGELRLKWIKNDHAPQAEESSPFSPQPLDPELSWMKPMIASSFPVTSYPRVSMLVYCLGPFRVYINDQAVENWPGHKCMQILKYFVTQRNTLVNQDVLMELFWPGVDIKGARRNLYQAIYKLRQTLQAIGGDFPYILTEKNCYRLNPELDIWVDSEAFTLCYQKAHHLVGLGSRDEATREFQMAEELYRGEFLAEDRYEDWPLVHRENLKNAYLDALDQLSQHFYAIDQLPMCIYYCKKILQEDNCREDAHRRVMLCYMKMEQPHLALRQYHVCVEALRIELDVLPMPATEELYKQIQYKRGK